MNFSIKNSIRKEIITTKDGSKSILLPVPGETYHSRNGALSESLHVFIEAGLLHFARLYSRKHIRILEMGLGTGLNAILSLLSAEDKDLLIHYTAVEAYPLDWETIEKLNYSSLFKEKRYTTIFKSLHIGSWESDIQLTPDFILRKVQTKIENFRPDTSIDLVYYDAFAPSVQPELWTKEIFDKLYHILSPGGMLVTYSAKGSVRRNLMKSGFIIERLPGPPGKREMLRATKK